MNTLLRLAASVSAQIHRRSLRACFSLPLLKLLENANRIVHIHVLYKSLSLPTSSCTELLSVCRLVCCLCEQLRLHTFLPSLWSPAFESVDVCFFVASGRLFAFSMTGCTKAATNVKRIA